MQRQSQTGWRRWIAAFALLAFAFQAQITQTHIHVPHASGIAMTGKFAPQKTAPAKDDTANCQICQAVLHGGQFVSPAAAALVLPTLAIVFVPLVLVTTAPSQSTSHNWQGRAPPRI